MITITGSVGFYGQNRIPDVEAVQLLLNRNLHFLKHVSSVTVDGIAGPKTILAIRKYQFHVLKMSCPSGLVEPGRTTLKWLNKTACNPGRSSVYDFIVKTLPAAKSIKVKYKIPVSVLLAQAALDLDWGRNIKTSSYYKPQSSKTHRKNHLLSANYAYGRNVIKAQFFSLYDNFYEAAYDYADYLSNNPRYRGAFEFAKKPLSFVNEIQRAGISSDPVYATRIKSLITKYALSEYDR